MASHPSCIKDGGPNDPSGHSFPAEEHDPSEPGGGSENSALARAADQQALKKLESDVQNAVRQVFYTLCGHSDQNDKFTG